MIIKIKDLAKYCGFHYTTLKLWLSNYQLSPWLIKEFGITLRYNLCDESIEAIKYFLKIRDETSPVRRVKTNRLENFNKGLERIKNEHQKSILRKR